MAKAHSPFFAPEVEVCELDSGEMVKLRILKGDGLFGPDPSSLVLVNSDNRMVGFHGVLGKVFLKGDDLGMCAAYDVTEKRFFTPNPDSFWVGDVVVGAEPGARNARYMIDNMRGAGRPDFGFQSRSPSWGETGRVWLLMIKQQFIAIILIGGLVFSLCWAAAWWKNFLKIKHDVWRVVVASLVSIAGIIFACFVGLLLFLLSDIENELVILAVGIGLFVFGVIRAYYNKAHEK